MSSAKKSGKKKAQAPSPADEAAARAEMEKAKEWLASLTPDTLLTPSLFDESKVDVLKQQFAAAKPFPYLSLPNFIDSDFLKQLLEELQNLDYVSKDNDLYLFSQTENDLKSATSPLVSKLREVLYSQSVISALSKISGIPLYGLDNPSKPDLFAAVYNDTSRLLCHDDELEGRRIAFILYLVPENWSDKDGGQLDLFYQDPTTGQPSHEATALVPTWAGFNFFEVSDKSYHQVREVLAAKKHRVSIGGWYHGPPLKRNPVVVETLPQQTPPKPMAEFLLAGAPVGLPAAPGKAKVAAEDIIDQWVHRQYRRGNVTKQVQKQFGEQSSIELKSFLRVDVYSDLVKELLDLEKKAFAVPAVVPAAAAAAAAMTDSADTASAAAPAAGESKSGAETQPALVQTQPVPAADSAFELVGPPNLRTYYKAKLDVAPTASSSVSSSSSSSAAAAAVPAAPAAAAAMGDEVSPASPVAAAAAAGAPAAAGAFAGLPSSSLVRRFHAFLRSTEFASFLTELTGCDFVSGHSELRLFRQGCYTLSYDMDKENRLEGLDVVFTAMDTVNGKKWRTTSGGSRHYTRAGEDEELLTIFPEGNTLALVYRTAAGSGADGDDEDDDEEKDEEDEEEKGEGEGGILQFTRYVDHHAPCGLFSFSSVMRLAPDEPEPPKAAAAKAGGNKKGK